MERLFHALIAAAQAHPGLALAVVGLVAFAESLAIVGTVVPAAVVMFAAGALVGQGALGLAVTLAVAAGGAIAGDAFSFELGRAREPQVRACPAFRRYEIAFQRAEGFVREHGAASVVFARFTGAVRAFVPLLAGFARMGRLRFYVANVASAWLWAAVHIFVGVVFGSSLGLAEAVSGRLAMMILLLVALVWVTVWLVGRVWRALLPLLQRARRRALAWAAGRSGALAAFAAGVLDPGRSGSRALLLGVVVLLGAGWMFVGVVQDVVARDPLVQADLAVQVFLDRLRTAPVDRAMAVISDLGSAVVLLAMAGVVALWLLLRGCRRTGLAWVGAVAGAALLAGVLALALGRAMPATAGGARLAWSGANVTLSTALPGFLAFLLARRATPRKQALIAAVVAGAVVLVAMSTLVLGAQWLSQVLAGVSLGLAWVALCALAVTQRQVDERLQPGRLALAAVATTVVATVVWHGGPGSAAERLVLARPTPNALTVADWAQTAWQTVPRRRRELDGDREERFGVQWACSQPDLDQALRGADWLHAAPWTLRNMLAALTGDQHLRAIPVLPRFDRGQPSALAFVRPAGTDRRAVLRLWRSTAVLSEGAEVQPIWYGSIYEERRVASGWLKGWVTLEAVEARPPALEKALGLPRGWVLGQPEGRVLLLRCR